MVLAKAGAGIFRIGDDEGAHPGGAGADDCVGDHIVAGDAVLAVHVASCWRARIRYRQSTCRSAGSRDRRRRILESDDAIGVVETRRSEEHTSELQSLMRISYAVFRLKKKKQYYTKRTH